MKLALLGYGRMGRAVHQVAIERGHQVTAILDIVENPHGNGITPDSLDGATVAIDFSTAGAVLPNVRRAAALGLGVVVGTTGWESDREAVEAAVRQAGTGLLAAPNFSVGMFLFTRLVEAAARLVNPLEEFDVHLSETHHRLKTDHPGGTARALADVLVRGLDRKTGWTENLPDRAALPSDQLQISVARIGDALGTHRVTLDGPHDRIELRHEAKTRTGFAAGAVLAAEWLEGRSGVFTMRDLMNGVS